MSDHRPFISAAREEFHKSLLKFVLNISENGVPSNADSSNKTSVRIASGITHKLSAETRDRAPGQTSGHQFEDLVAKFIQNTFLKFEHLRPGKWEVKQVVGRRINEIAKYAQYGHLDALQQIALENPEIAAAIGNDYVISPDVIVTRALEKDEFINKFDFLVDSSVSAKADLRQGEQKLPILHASISTKWTLRSDRAQNARSEALNLIRNRKGRQPHIVVVTAEPTPSRLASLALGTGDIDCVYHFALDELINSVADINNSEAEDMLAIMINGKRLKDISDLPLDLAV